MREHQKTFIFIFKKPDKPSKTQEEILLELIQSAIRKAVAR
ncbi:hypothetical protein [Bacillus sp. FJAT-27225]|nr:hypothetical protein [Bacillus sp. FJAT-27225]